MSEPGSLGTLEARRKVLIAEARVTARRVRDNQALFGGYVGAQMAGLAELLDKMADALERANRF